MLSLIRSLEEFFSFSKSTKELEDKFLTDYYRIRFSLKSLKLAFFPLEIIATTAFQRSYFVLYIKQLTSSNSLEPPSPKPYNSSPFIENLSESYKSASVSETTNARSALVSDRRSSDSKSEKAR